MDNEYEIKHKILEFLLNGKKFNENHKEVAPHSQYGTYNDYVKIIHLYTCFQTSVKTKSEFYRIIKSLDYSGEISGQSGIDDIEDNVRIVTKGSENYVNKFHLKERDDFKRKIHMHRVRFWGTIIAVVIGSLTLGYNVFQSRANKSILESLEKKVEQLEQKYEQ